MTYLSEFSIGPWSVMIVPTRRKDVYAVRCGGYRSPDFAQGKWSYYNWQDVYYNILESDDKAACFKKYKLEIDYLLNQFYETHYCKDI